MTSNNNPGPLRTVQFRVNDGESDSNTATKGISVSGELMEDLVDIAVTECERFYPAFQFVIWGGKSPLEALTAAMLETEGEA